MITSNPFDGWGNKLIQYCFARALGVKLNYYVSCRKLPYLVNSGNFNVEGDRILSPVVTIDHKGKYRHMVDMEELQSMRPCHFNIRSYLEYYPNLEPFRDNIVNDWCVIPNNFTSDNIKLLSGHFKKFQSGKLVTTDVENINSNDLVLSVRLGRDYLGQHRYRLLIGDYFKIILDNTDYDRVFITSQDPYNPILEDLYKYDPIFLDHISALHTFNFVRLFNNIALSQSTYSWWAGFLSTADRIYFPITKDGPWSYGPNQRKKWKDFNHDLMVDEPKYQYISYNERSIIGDYETTRSYLNL